MEVVFAVKLRLGCVIGAIGLAALGAQAENECLAHWEGLAVAAMSVTQSSDGFLCHVELGECNASVFSERIATERVECV